MKRLLICTVPLGCLLAAAPALAADHPSVKTRAYSTPQLLFALRTDTQTLARMTPVQDPSYDFTPGPREAERQYDGYPHLGDLALKARVGNGPWHRYSSFAARQPVRVLAAGRALAAADISRSMGHGLPLTVERRWLSERGVLVMRYTLINRGQQPVQVAAPAMPMVFDQRTDGRPAAEAQVAVSTVKPHPGERGFVEVARLNGQPPALRVEPDGRTPLTGWQPAPAAKPQDDYASWVTQGFTLQPGAKRDIGVRFVIQAQGATR
jgi:hypothetical protein